MKIRRLQITMEPRMEIDGLQYITVQVRTDCGNIYSTMQVIADNHFQDLLSCLMKDAEHRIRQLVKGKSTPADNKV